MAVNDIVRIVVEIVDRFSDEINELETKMAAATRDRKQDVDVELHGTAKAIAEVKRITRPETKQVFVQTTLDGGIASGEIPSLEEMRKGLHDSIGKGKDTPLDNIKRSIGRLLPTYHKWITLISLLLPMVIALGVALMGVATAMGAVALAGGAMLGLGLLGGGRNMATAFEEARRKVQQFKQEVFEVVRPLAQVFQPFTDRFLALAPGQLTPLVRAAESLEVFQDSFERAFVGVVEWVAEAIRATADYKAEIDSLIETFGPALGRGIIDFFRFVVEEAYENQDVLLALAGTFKQILRAVYEFSLFIGYLAVAFSPVVEVVTWLAEIFQNKLLVSLTGAILAFTAILMLGARMILMFSAIHKTVILMVAAFKLASSVGGIIAGIQAALQMLNITLGQTAILAAIATGGLALLAGLAAGYATYKSVSDMQERTAGRMGGSALPGGFGNSYAPAVDRGSSVSYNINIESVTKENRQDVLSDMESFTQKNNHRRTPDPGVTG
jgi:hypothetical protein